MCHRMVFCEDPNVDTRAVCRAKNNPLLESKASREGECSTTLWDRSFSDSVKQKLIMMQRHQKANLSRGQETSSLDSLSQTMNKYPSTGGGMGGTQKQQGGR